MSFFVLCYLIYIDIYYNKPLYRPNNKQTGIYIVRFMLTFNIRDKILLVLN